jgi:hypothetical protein
MDVFLKELFTDWKAKELLLGFVVAIMLISLYHSREIDAENFALGAQNTSAIEMWQGKPFTGYSPPAIQKLIGELSDDAASDDSYWLWLGNSQLHTINQKKEGDHLAPYWLREELACRDCPQPIGISLPNANLQEYLFVERYIQQHLKVKGVIVPLVFDDLREDGIRDEIADLVDAELEADLSNLPSGRTMLQSIKRSTKKGAVVNMNASFDTEDDFQKRLEHTLEKAMGHYFPLWNERSNLKAILTIDMYYARNWLLNIKPTTVRKMIDTRYEHNMNAFQDLLRLAQTEHRDMVVYIVPIRQDLPLPYEIERYEEWKKEVERLAHQYGAQFLNLEKIIPPIYWGSYHGDDVDFMHFQGPGHRLVAKEIQKQLGR